MPYFHFNPSLWFVCKSCREPFSDTDKFKAHKLECHLGESLNVKCIVFEETLLDHEWIPPAADNILLSSTAPQEERKGSYLKKIPFRNPYVSLEVLSKEELVSKLNKNLSSQPPDPIADPGPGPSLSPFSQNKIRAKRNQQISKSIRTESNKSPITVVSNPLSPAKFYLKINFDRDEANSNEDSTDFCPVIKIELEAEKLEETPTDFESHPQNLGNNHSDMNDLDVDVNNTSTNEDFEAVAHTNAECGNGELMAKAATSPVKRKTRAKPRAPKKKKLPSRSFKCDICGLFSVSRHHLHLHMTTHSDPRRFNCRFCDAAFKSGPALQHHLIIHGKSTRYMCRFCDKSFSSNRDLVGHESCHTGDRPFKCHVGTCPLAFRTKSSLFLHTRVVHREELGLPHFLCVTCGMTFGLASILKRHIQRNHPLTVTDVSPSPLTLAQSNSET